MRKRRGEFEAAIAVSTRWLKLVVDPGYGRLGVEQKGSTQRSVASSRRRRSTTIRFGGSIHQRSRFRSKGVGKKGDTQLGGEFEAAIAVYDEVVERFGESDTPEVQVPVAWALVEGKYAKRAWRVRAAAIAVYDEVVERFESDVPKAGAFRFRSPRR